MITTALGDYGFFDIAHYVDNRQSAHIFIRSKLPLMAL